jgi:hypothetical protein
MERSTSDKTQHQAAFASRIIRIFFEQLSMLNNCANLEALKTGKNENGK